MERAVGLVRDLIERELEGSDSRKTGVKSSQAIRIPESGRQLARTGKFPCGNQSCRWLCVRLTTHRDTASRPSRLEDEAACRTCAQVRVTLFVCDASRGRWTALAGGPRFKGSLHSADKLIDPAR